MPDIFIVFNNMPDAIFFYSKKKADILLLFYLNIKKCKYNLPDINTFVK